MSLDVKQLYGVAQLQTLAMAAETVEVSAGAGGGGSLGAYKRAAAPLPPATTAENCWQCNRAVRVPNSITLRELDTQLCHEQRP